MALGEFDLIARFFTHAAPRAVVGPGDDCAVLQPAPGAQWAVSTDMLIEGRHFLPTVAPAALGHKALAVNLSDLAACGARPLAFTLALGLPRVDEPWLEAFSSGMMALARDHGCELVGGDTTAAPVVTISITVFGELPAAIGAPPGAAPAAEGSRRTMALLRRGAQPGDEIWVSGLLGDARLALEALRGTVMLDGAALARTRRALEWPTPRVALGQALQGLASAAIDLSDGLVGDLGHVLTRSEVGATLNVDALPRSPDLAAQAPAMQRLCTLAGGDDYELLFTAPAGRHAAVLAAAAAAGVAATCIGHINAGLGLRLQDSQGRAVDFRGGGFDHFRSEAEA